MGTEAAGDEEGAILDKDGEGADGDGGEGHGGTAEKVEDDVHFQGLGQPAQQEEPGGRIQGPAGCRGKNSRSFNPATLTVMVVMTIALRWQDAGHDETRVSLFSLLLGPVRNNSQSFLPWH